MSPVIDRLRSRTAAFTHDLLTIPIAWMLAYWLRFNLDTIPAEFLTGALQSLPWVILIQAGVDWLFGLYRGVWRFASIPDLVRITKAVLVGTALVVVVLFILNRSQHVPRSVPVLYLGIQFILLTGPRLLYRWLKDQRFNLSSGQRVLIVGADRAGDLLARDLLRDPSRAYFPVGFVDDTLRRQGSEVQGLPVLGPTSLIPEIVREHDIQLIMLAVTGANAREMRRLVELCEQTGRPFRILPDLRGLLTGEVDFRQLRPVSIEDLLGREPVELDWPEIRAGLAGRDILVTGAGGSIGSELVRQLATAGPSRLILVDHGEFNLYRIEMELSETHPELPMTRRLLDVTDAIAIEALFRDERPAIVFHAAAYKHVPLLEDQPRTAVRNNVFGTLRVAEAAVANGVERFVLISTDKAVNPTSVMGATKRLAEVLCQDLNGRSACRFITVRFGNVLGSAGSVVPLFRRQIEQGGPVTVTHPEIERFFMTIPEASQLIMQAAVIGDGGEVFVLDMGEPIKIRYLAEQMIRLSGREPGEDIAIEYIGLRPGEKLYEELFHDSEQIIETRHPKIHRARQSNGLGGLELKEGLNRLAQAVEASDQGRILSTLRELLPDWQPAPVHFNQNRG
ncbi:polysaccharide biosynthesis protein [Thermochromatium tepidum]|uniref:NAD-dependent epimerase/dehydratase family protein n=1 Tax=Thermochromatium tepidum ATCC 43061 TaxID=316276 RepID=A0A6I6EF14_THETI|nr:nucleoside-diphosphate sugar epimerase/dehydratase [Thermochromatium tepidum]QGU31957.1 NAD-dependent epimerase/dehydratase family protein [Thermochromatium tepidum ATCC 43061]